MSCPEASRPHTSLLEAWGPSGPPNLIQITAFWAGAQNVLQNPLILNKNLHHELQMTQAQGLGGATSDTINIFHQDIENYVIPAVGLCFAKRGTISGAWWRPFSLKTYDYFKTYDF